MRSFIITEETFQPVMFSRLHQEAQEVIDQGDDSIAYIENKKRMLVRDNPCIIQGIADLLALQLIPYRTFKGDQVDDVNKLFDGLVA